MDWLDVLLVYILIAAVAMTATFLEGAANGNRWDVARVAGLAFCLVWPLVLAAIFAILAFQRLRRSKTPPIFQLPSPIWHGTTESSAKLVVR